MDLRNDKLRVLTNVEAAKVLRVSPRHLASLRSRQEGPPFIRIGRLGKVLYPVDELEAWLRAGCHETGSHAIAA